MQPASNLAFKFCEDSQRLAENNKCIAWSFRLLVEVRYELINCPMLDVLSGNRISSLLLGTLDSVRYLLIIAACELLPHRSTPSNKMNAPLFVAAAAENEDIDDNNKLQMYNMDETNAKPKLMKAGLIDRQAGLTEVMIEVEFET